MENSFVQVMTFSMVAKIEAENVEAFTQQTRAGGEHVGRDRTALPAMQQHRQCATGLLCRSKKPLQTHTIATVHQPLLLTPQQLPGAVPGQYL